MSLPSNAHTHSTHSDGKNTLREMVQRALALGMTGLGFTDHSPAPFDPTCLGVLDEAAYQAEVLGLQQEYQHQISILCGIEQDYFAPINRQSYAYIVGSVHYLPLKTGVYYAADGEPAQLRQAVQQQYKGDAMAMVEDFYALSVENVRTYQPEIVGHFDLITKLNPSEHFFDEQSQRYRDIALTALDEVCNLIKPYNGIVEINTGGMSRGYRNIPYPAPFLLRHIAQKGVRVMVSSDSHAVETLNYYFEESVQLAADAGLKKLAVLQGGSFVDIDI